MIPLALPAIDAEPQAKVKCFAECRYHVREGHTRTDPYYACFSHAALVSGNDSVRPSLLPAVLPPAAHVDDADRRFLQ